VFIVAAWGDLLVSRMISLCTVNPFRAPRWGPSHLAVIISTPSAARDTLDEEHLWVESSTLLPHVCALSGKKVIGLQFHRISDRWGDYPQGNIQVYRLSDPLTAVEEQVLGESLLQDMRHRSDYSPPSLSKRLLFRTQQTLLCSEFVQEILERTGRSSSSRKAGRSPANFLRHHLQQGTIVREPH
jgi:hypothetical protein